MSRLAPTAMATRTGARPRCLVRPRRCRAFAPGPRDDAAVLGGTRRRRPVYNRRRVIGAPSDRTIVSAACNGSALSGCGASGPLSHR